MSLLIFILAIRPIGIGIWSQSELMTAGLHFTAFLSAIGVLLLNFHKRISAMVFVQPLVLLPLCLGGLSLLFLPLQNGPVRDFLGDVRTGEGVVWWFDLSVLSASAMVLWRYKNLRRILIKIAVFSFAVCFALSVSHEHMPHYRAPFYFPDYLAFLILCLLPLAYMRWFGRENPLWRYVVFYVVLNILIVLSENKAMILFSVILPLLWWGYWWIAPRLPIPQKTIAMIGIAALPLALFALFAVVVFMHSSEGYYAYEHDKILKTLASRAFLAQTAIVPMLDQPWTFLHGFGWGTYTDHLVNYQPSRWMDFTLYGRQWDGYMFDHFHSHNMFVETFNAVGVLGGVLIFVYCLAFALTARPSLYKPAMVFTSGLMVWGSLWFLFPLHNPFWALAAASLARPVKTFRLNKKFLAGALVVIMICQAIAGSMTFITAYRFDEVQTRPLSAAQARQNCPVETYKDFDAGGVHLSRLMLDRLRYVLNVKAKAVHEYTHETRADIPRHLLHVNYLFCLADDYIKHDYAGARVKVAHLVMRGEILLGLGEYLDEEARAYYYDGWEEELKGWLRAYPGRADLATPYLLYSLANGREQSALPIAEMIYRHDPVHPLGLWFKGLADLNDPQTANMGLSMMRMALDNGIERFMPVDDDLRNMLEPPGNSP